MHNSPVSDFNVLEDQCIDQTQSKFSFKAHFADNTSAFSQLRLLLNKILHAVCVFWSVTPLD